MASRTGTRLVGVNVDITAGESCVIQSIGLGVTHTALRRRGHVRIGSSQFSLRNESTTTKGIACRSRAVTCRRTRTNRADVYEGCAEPGCIVSGIGLRMAFVASGRGRYVCCRFTFRP